MKNIVITALLLFSFSLTAQQRHGVTFSETTFDFGTIKEENGPVTHEFTFNNNGAVPLKILGVKASCGCTTPGWSKEEIKPGESGFVKAQYNPLNRPGPFHKSLTVTTNGTKSTHVLYIKGNVTPRPKSVEEQFPVVMGNLRAQHKTLNFGRIKNNKTVTREFEVYNGGDEPVTFKDEFDAPDHMSIAFKDKTLPPKEKGILIVSYDAKAKNDLGFVRDNVVIYTDEAEGRKEFYVYASIDQYFPPLSAEERALAPKISIDQHSLDLGRVSSGSVVEKELTVTNNGKSDLSIRKISTTCRCISYELEEEVIKPDQEAKLKIVFNSQGLKGSQQKSITIFNSDPSQPAKKILLKGYVN